jgi:3-oxo-5-alpha-steroid 4-dehydrogenase 1
MPLLIAGSAIAFNLLNASVNAPQLSSFGAYDSSWLRDPRFLIGAAIFFLGFTLNIRADNVLFSLRKPGEKGYRVPYGALHDLVANPNYLGEIVEWTGWAIATWSLAGASFALYTAANLVPRALANRKWMRERLPDYPRERRAIIPFIL